MKHVKLFEAFSTHKPLTKRQINWLDKCTTGNWSLNPSTGLVDVDGDFDCISQRLKDFKGVAFAHVKGDFSCNDNLLTSLAGAPQTVTDLYCHRNQLTSLEGAPLSISNLHCHGNPVSIKTLESVFEVMKSEKSYQQSLMEYWPEMDNDDKALLYKYHISLSPKEINIYKALEICAGLRGYL